MTPFQIIEPSSPKVPIIISIPHCGTEFPDELINDYLPEQVASIDDTDWFLQDLNDFASSMGITVVYAKYSRWVIDLNRDPQSAPLYNDGRLITGLTTTTDFIGNPIYKTGKEPDQTEDADSDNEDPIKVVDEEPASLIPYVLPMQSCSVGL